MKIALIAGPIPYTVSLARALSTHCQVDFICGEAYARQNDATILSTLPDNVKVILYQEYRRRDIRSVLSCLKLISLLKKNKYDVIHLQYSGTLPMSFFWWKIRHIPLVVTIHDPYQHPGLPMLLSLSQDYLQHFFSKRAKKIIVHGEIMRTLFCKKHSVITPENVVDLPHGDLSICFFSSTPIQPKLERNMHVILFFGTIRPNKGVEYLIRAEPIIAREFDEFIIKIYGHGDFSVAEKHIENPRHFEVNNSFIPHSEVPQLFNDADVVVLPYTSATQTGIIPMAYAAGRPVIATRTGGLPDVVIDGETGILVDPGDEKALASAIIRILKDEKLRFKMGENALAYCNEKLSWDSIGRKTCVLYRQCTI